ncbi:G-protein coupled receptor 183-like [Oryctolagus cuniculus]|uniref:G-protein coupled receptor 183-like n=1 Tax=Oryctolagus cuniculus TaxID=9986 RepID=UPI0038790864
MAGGCGTALPISLAPISPGHPFFLCQGLESRTDNLLATPISDENGETEDGPHWFVHFVQIVKMRFDDLHGLKQMASTQADPSSLPLSAGLCLPHVPGRAACLTLCLFHAALLVLGVLGNSLALCLTCRGGKKINSAGVYLVHLALSHLLWTSALPGTIIYYARGFHWPFGDGLCRLTAFLVYANTYGGVYLSMCLSVDCYLAVVRAHGRPRPRSAHQAGLVCASVWGLALLQTVPLLWTPLAKPAAGKLTCVEHVGVEPILGLPLPALLTCAIGFCGPVSVMLFCYVAIASKLRREARDSPRARRRGGPRRACLLSLLVLVAVAVCFGPYQLHLFQFMVRAALRPPSCAERRAFARTLQLTAALRNMSCGLDPVVYFFASTRDRKWLLRVLKLRAFSSSGPGEKLQNQGGRLRVLDREV